MGSWGMPRRLAGLCMSGITRQVAAGRRVPMCSVTLVPTRSLHYAPQRFMLSAEHSSSSSFSASSTNSLGFPRPEEIPWQKGLVNNVTLIGRINRSIDIKYLDSGKIVANASIRVQRYAQTEDTVFSLQFWDELAEIAAAHLKLDDRVYIAGSVWVENYMDKDSLLRSYCKVIVKDLKFVGDDYRTSNGANNEVTVEHKETTSLFEGTSSTEEMWRAFFQSPSDYWDNRVLKLNPKSPDFKHKSSGTPLWINSKTTPSWVIERLNQESFDMETSSQVERVKELEKLWQLFFANPLEWWDNRNSKKTPKHPDFKNKTSGEALWIEGKRTPSWVKSQLEILDSKAKTLKEGGAKVEWANGLREKTPKTSFEDEDLNFF